MLQDSLFDLLKFAFKGIFIPFVLPYLVYNFYKNQTLDLSLLNGKVVLITGASSGLGEALAKLLYRCGCKLILASRNINQLERVKNELVNEAKITSQIYYDPVIIALDLSDLSDIQIKAAKALEFYGEIDILINNAGISYRGSIVETNIQVDQKLMLINYFGQVAMTKAILPKMIQSNKGHIVMISSVQGKIAIPFRSSYAASKHALIAFSDTLRAELANTNIKVCVISPGYIKTNLSVNAVTGDGSNYGILDSTTASGLSPDKVARSIALSILKNDKEVLLCPSIHKLAIFLRIIAPGLYFYIMKRRAIKENKSKNN